MRALPTDRRKDMAGVPIRQRPVMYCYFCGKCTDSQSHIFFQCAPVLQAFDKICRLTCTMSLLDSIPHSLLLLFPVSDLRMPTLIPIYFVWAVWKVRATHLSFLAVPPPPDVVVSLIVRVCLPALFQANNKGLDCVSQNEIVEYARRGPSTGCRGR